MKTFNPYPLRIDEELMEELKEMAEAHSRSVNKEIEYLVKEAVKKYRLPVFSSFTANSGGYYNDNSKKHKKQEANHAGRQKCLK